MYDNLKIPVTYYEQELNFPAKVIMIGYTHKIQVEVDGQPIMFEPDEERNYRALVDASQLEKGFKLDVKLLQAIAQVLDQS